MRLFALAVAAGLAGGYARGGRFGCLGRLRLRAPVLVGTALALQAGAGLVAPSRRLVLVAASYVLVGAWLMANARGRALAIRLGLGLVALGWLLNVVPIAALRGMPVSAAALQEAGLPAGYDVADGHNYKHVVDRRSTPVDWMGDVIPVRPLDAVISLGDVALLAGIALFLAGAMAPAAPTPRTGGGLVGPGPHNDRRFVPPVAAGSTA